MFAIPNPRIIIGAALVAGVLAAFWWVYEEGKDVGKKDVVVEIEKARTESAEEKEKIDEEVRDLDDEELLRRALDAVRP